MVTITLPATGSPKKRLVEMALGKCGIIDYGPQEAAFALNELNSLMLTAPYSALGYQQGDGSLEELSGIDPQWDLAVSLALAESIAPLMMNAQPLSPSAMAALARQTSMLRAAVATLPTSLIVSAVRGSGGRRRIAYIHETTAVPGADDDEFF